MVDGNQKCRKHTSSFGDEFDWRSRVKNCVGRDVELRQLSYQDPSDPEIEMLYPDGSLSLDEEIFTESIAERLASEIYDLIISKGYSREVLYMNSHAPDDVCGNSAEHDDHRIVGNAVKKSINILLDKGINAVHVPSHFVRWLTRRLPAHVIAWLPQSYGAPEWSLSRSAPDKDHPMNHKREQYLPRRVDNARRKEGKVHLIPI